MFKLLGWMSAGLLAIAVVTGAPSGPAVARLLQEGAGQDAPPLAAQRQFFARHGRSFVNKDYLDAIVMVAPTMRSLETGQNVRVVAVVGRARIDGKLMASPNSLKIMNPQSADATTLSAGFEAEGVYREYSIKVNPRGEHVWGSIASEEDVEIGFVEE